VSQVAEAYELARRCLSETLPRRWLHVQGVAARARKVSVTVDMADRDLLVSAAILHDIGYAPEIALTGFHALDGARYLAACGAPKRLCALVAHHSCAYREAELRGLSAELSEWVDEEGSVRDSLWWADMTTTPDGEITNVESRIEEIEKRYGPEDLVTFFIRQAKPELIGAVERTESRIRAMDLTIQ
jgi:hypothetical protein